MAIVYATKNGNWSDVTVWNTGALPATIDDVYANNFTVTLTGNVTVASLRNTSATSIAAGGKFQMLVAYSVTADIYAGAVASNTLYITGLSTGSINFVGNWYGGTIFASYAVYIFSCSGVNITFTGNSTGGQVQGCSSIQIASCSTLSVNFNGILTGGFGIQSPGLYISGSNNTINVTGTVNGSSNGNQPIANTSPGLNIAATASICTVYGNCSAISGHVGLVLSSGNSTVIVIGNVYGGTGAGGIGAYNNTILGVLQVFHAIGGTGDVGISSISATATTTVERVTFNANGVSPIGSFVKFKRVASNQVSAYNEAGNLFVMSDTTNLSNQFPVPSNVRNGTVYAAGNYVGTLAVPIASNVRKGFAVDATIGTAELTSLEFWGALLADNNVAGSFGKLIKDYLDTAISSRLSASNYQNPISAATIATAVWSAVTRTLTSSPSATKEEIAQQVWEYVTRGLTESPDVPSVSEISEQVWSDIPVRLQNVATAEIVSEQIQANFS